MTHQPLQQSLQDKLKSLNELLWDTRLNWPRIERWLENFVDADPNAQDKQRLHGLYLLSHFTFFNSRLMRSLLRTLFRDLVRYPMVAQIRRANANTRDTAKIEAGVKLTLQRARFMGIGNPSESGTHILYYFRQENGLSKSLFVSPHELLEPSGPHSLTAGNVDTIYILDDFSGSGSQAKRYAGTLVKRLRASAPSVAIHYYILFATTRGLLAIRKTGAFDRVEAVCELDESFRCFDVESRYFRDAPTGISRRFGRAMCHQYGRQLNRGGPLGFGKCQLLLGFEHNIPNNTLPIIWADGSSALKWTPAFRRYKKAPSW